MLHLQRMFLYSTYTGPRLAYMADWLGRRLFGQPLVIVHDIASIPSKAFVLNYSLAPISIDSFCIHPQGLLSQTGIQPQEIAIKNINNLPCFFTTEDDFGFDVLAASFYLMQRYEEYLPHEKDIYGRYAHENSLAFKNGFLHLPLIDLWLLELKEWIKRKSKYVPVFKTDTFAFLPTYDIDVAYNGLGKSLGRLLLRNMRTLGSEARLDTKKYRVDGKWKDAFDMYDELTLLHKKYMLDAMYFFLVAQKPHRYDRNIHPDTKEMQDLITWSTKENKVGIHPSWQSGDSDDILKNEIGYLARTTGSTIQNSRQHYIRMDLPLTYQRLIPLGITGDYSMGYGSINGFRASTSWPYDWYDLSAEKHTALKIFPFCYMEANSIYEHKETPEQALESFKKYLAPVKKTGGTMVSIFHNHLIGYDAKGRQWMQMYRMAIEACM